MSNINLRIWQIRTARAVAVLVLGIPGAMWADNMAYDVTSSAQFGIVDLNTGVFTLINATQGAQLAGLAEVSGTLYGGGFFDEQLYQVNTATGDLTPIGSGGTGRYSAFGSTTLGGIYGTSSLPGAGNSIDLYSVDPLTGAPTLIGPTGLTNFNGNWLALSTGNGTLYFSQQASVGSTNTNIYSLNPATGAATLVATVPWPEIGGIVFEDGTFYLGSNLAPYGIFASPPNGLIATESGAPPFSQGPFWGLAPAPPSVPEPRSFTLLLTSLGVVGWAMRRGRSTRC